jgi:hypothetical protein
MLVTKRGCLPHFEQRGEVGLGRSCFSMPVCIENLIRRFSWVKFPVLAKKFPVPRKYFPVNLRRELRRKSLRHRGFLLRNRPSAPQNRKIPCKIPWQQGIFVETGAISTASPARQSGAQRKCLQYLQKGPPMAGFCKLATSLQAPILGIL